MLFDVMLGGGWLGFSRWGYPGIELGLRVWEIGGGLGGVEFGNVWGVVVDHLKGVSTSNTEGDGRELSFGWNVHCVRSLISSSARSVLSRLHNRPTTHQSSF